MKQSSGSVMNEILRRPVLSIVSAVSLSIIMVATAQMFGIKSDDINSYIAAIGVVGLTITLMFNFLAWKQTSDANRSTIETAHSERRAYVGVSAVSTSGLPAKIVVSLENFGQTSAFGVRVAVTIGPNVDVPEILRAKQIGVLDPRLGANFSIQLAETELVGGALNVWPIEVVLKYEDIFNKTWSRRTKYQFPLDDRSGTDEKLQWDCVEAEEIEEG